MRKSNFRLQIDLEMVGVAASLMELDSIESETGYLLMAFSHLLSVLVDLIKYYSTKCGITLYTCFDGLFIRSA